MKFPKEKKVNHPFFSLKNNSFPTMKEITQENERLRAKIHDLEKWRVRHQLADEALKESEEKYRKLVKASPEAVTVTDLKGIITDVSEETLKLHGYEEPEALIGKSAYELIAPEDRSRANSNLLKILRRGILKNEEYSFLRKDGTRFAGEINSALIKDAKSRPKQIISTCREITERKKIEDELKSSLKEKEILLREVHHRVKNNLQIISGLLDMKALQPSYQEVKQLCQDARAEIHTMALIHEHLYQSGRFSQIEMGGYIKDLVSYLFQVYSDKMRFITPVLDYSKVFLNINQALPLAIILSEAISNVYKHAFQKGQEGTLEIALKKAEKELVFLRIKDDGCGIPQSLDIDSTRTLGLKLMKNLVEDQLKGKFYV
ncbi:MAG: sensor histidine kinase, partial [Acidobacteriota bacterium]